MMEIPAKILIIIDPTEIRRAMKAGEALSLLFEFDQWLREEIKYRDKNEYTDVRDKLHSILDDRGINLDDLLT
ncbi:MAG TPA: hypothetical protein P5531_04095 [Bacteroidales bacterium]|nr:hypothetical protein [Bacteroidales bacterium]